MNARVEDAADHPVPNLKAGDFVLLEDGEPRSFPFFKSVEGGTETGYAHGIVVLDAVNNSSPSIAKDRRGIEQFLKQKREPLEYPLSFAVLSSYGLRQGAPSRDRKALLAQLEELTRDVHPISCADEVNPNDAFMRVWMPDSVTSPESTRQLACLNRRFTLSVASVEKLALGELDKPGRAIVIWIGPGWPLLYNSQFRPDGRGIRQNLFTHLVQVSTALREAQVTLDMVSPPDFFRKTEMLNDHDRSLLDGVPREDEATVGTLSLQALAHRSGGIVYIDSKSISDGIAACMADADSYYVLSFDVPAADVQGQFHSLTVKVDRPGVKVRTTTMYYAPQ